MDVQSIVNLMSKITSTDYSDRTSFESNFKQVLELDPSKHSDEYVNQSTRFSTVIKAIELLFRVKDCLSKKSNDQTDIILSVAQCATVSKCVDHVISLGFIPCIIPSVWKSFENKEKHNIILTEDIPPNKQYEELKYNVKSFFDLMNDLTLKKLILSKYTDILIAALCQLSLLPIAKPGTKAAEEFDIDEFKYEELINEQNKFKYLFEKLILMDRDPLVIREIMFILGRKNNQKHLKHGLEELFSDLLVQSNGIQTFLRVACDLITETSQNFNQCGLQEWSNLIHNFYRKSKPEYIQLIVPQIWDLLRSNSKFHQNQFQSISIYCIHLMWQENFSDFYTFYMRPLEQSMNRSKLQKVEDASVFSRCIEDLHTLFYVYRDEMWSLSPKLLTNVAPIIYNVYTATISGVYYLKSKLEEMVFLILTHFTESKDHLKLIVFSQYQVYVTYDEDIGNIKIKCVEREHQLNLENQMDIILKLIDKRADSKLMRTIFLTLLDMYTDTLSNEYSVMEKLFIVKGILHLIEKDDVQKSIATDSGNILNLIKSIFKGISEDDKVDIQVLSIALMVLDCVLENLDKKCIDQLDCFLNYLPKIYGITKDIAFKNVVLETEHKIKNIQKSCLKEPIRSQRTIDNILFDSRDPLLPCRAHALIELKQMIESGNKSVLAKKSAILIVIKENLKNADSYLYLSAVFTLSSLCTHYPNEILPILCEEYSSPNNYNCSSETRLKIGEVLMKTVRSINETIPSYKNQLLNTFMAGVRDEDHLVRASSLSNLADVCRLLRYNLGSIVNEIVNCVDNVLKFDREVEPRRAAILLLQMIIQGADTELLEILEDNIKDIYKMLKVQYQSDNDETIKLHAQVAIERLNDIMKSLFLDNKNNFKTILK